MLEATNTEKEGRRNRIPRSFKKIMVTLNRLGFMVNGDTVGWDNTARLANGQNRLMGIAETGKSVLLACLWGIDCNAFETIDQHAKRSGGDVLAIAGFSHTKDLAAALSWQVAYDSQSASNGSATISNDQIVKIAQQNPEIIAADNAIRGVYNVAKVIPYGLAVFLWSQFSQRDTDLCKQLFDRVFKSIGLIEHSHEYRLMKRLKSNPEDPDETDSQRKGRTRKIEKSNLSRQERAAIIIKTWNRMREGAPPPGRHSTLMWKNIEAFPTIV